jgi:LmbE family N-acetylglucosaminyl deacetylase/glycosyltransferase involved in cell wall biosynthesis
MKQETGDYPFEAVKSVGNGRVLVFAPHPDDEVFSCGGAIVRHVEHGDPLKVIIATDGGYPVTGQQSIPEYKKIRKEESRNAAKVLGYGEPEFLGYEDRGLKFDEKLIIHLHDIISKFQPQFVYLPAHSEIHPDHRILSKAVTEAAKRYQPNINLIYTELGQIQSVNLLLDITDVHDQLNRAIDCFPSQLAVLDYKHFITALHTYRTYTLGKEVKYAEAYHFINSKKIKTGSELWKQKPVSASLPEKQKFPEEEYPLISVIVRTMNRPELAEALDSLSKQTYPNMEVIVVDALGTGKLQLGDHCGNIPLRVVSENKQLPRANAANVGLNAVKGEYFCFLDEDDQLFSFHLVSLFKLISNSEAVAAYSNIKTINSKNELLFTHKPDFNLNKLLWVNQFPIHSVLFRRKPIQHKCSFDDAFDIYEDWDFMIQVALLGDFIHHDEVSGIYIKNNLSGVDDEEKIHKYRTQIYDKWKSKLSGNQYIGFLDYLSALNLPEKEYYEKKYNEEQHKLREIQQKLNEEQQKFKTLHLKLKKEQNLNVAITNSLSWRITEPFRKISAVIRGKN